jgi:hypothetical protein
MRFSFMSGMAFRIATLKRSWKKEGLMLIMPHSIVGLSVMPPPLQQKLTLSFIHNDLIRKAIIVNCLLEKGSCSVFITVLRQHEIKRITVTINGSV